MDIPPFLKSIINGMKLKRADELSSSTIKAALPAGQGAINKFNESLRVSGDKGSEPRNPMDPLFEFNDLKYKAPDDNEYKEVFAKLKENLMKTENELMTQGISLNKEAASQGVMGKNGDIPYLSYLQVDEAGNVIAHLLVTEKVIRRTEMDMEGNKTMIQKEGDNTLITGDKCGTFMVSGKPDLKTMHQIMDLRAKSKEDASKIAYSPKVKDKDKAAIDRYYRENGVVTDISDNSHVNVSAGVLSALGIYTAIDASVNKDSKQVDMISLIAMDPKHPNKNTRINFRRMSDGTYVRDDQLRVKDNNEVVSKRPEPYKLEDIKALAMKNGYNFPKLEQFVIKAQSRDLKREDAQNWMDSSARLMHDIQQAMPSDEFLKTAREKRIEELKAITDRTKAQEEELAGLIDGQVTLNIIKTAREANKAKIEEKIPEIQRELEKNKALLSNPSIYMTPNGQMSPEYAKISQEIAKSEELLKQYGIKVKALSGDIPRAKDQIQQKPVVAKEPNEDTKKEVAKNLNRDKAFNTEQEKTDFTNKHFKLITIVAASMDKVSLQAQKEELENQKMSATAEELRDIMQKISEIDGQIAGLDATMDDLKPKRDKDNNIIDKFEKSISDRYEIENLKAKAIAKVQKQIEEAKEKGDTALVEKLEADIVRYENPDKETLAQLIQNERNDEINELTDTIAGKDVFDGIPKEDAQRGAEKRLLELQRIMLIEKEVEELEAKDPKSLTDPEKEKLANNKEELKHLGYDSERETRKQLEEERSKEAQAKAKKAAEEKAEEENAPSL